MKDGVLRAQLRSLGIDSRTWRAAALLPLVEVAWADGRVQTAERKHILELAHKSGALAGDGRLVVEGWLAFQPSPGYFRRGRDVIRALQDQLAEDGVALNDILDGCEAVARAAGGLFGIIGTVAPVERNLLAEIADELPAAADWDGLMDQLDYSVEDWTDDDPTEFFEADEATDPAVLDFNDKTAGPHLVVYQGEPPTVIVLSGALRVGRAGDNDLVLNMDAKASRRHCQLYEQQGRWYVVDSGSANGTLVDGERVLERQLFGDEQLRIGDSLAHFRV